MGQCHNAALRLLHKSSFGPSSNFSKRPCCKTWVPAIPAAYLLCSTAIRRAFAQPDVFAAVNFPVVVLNVFYFTVSMRSLTFLEL